MTDEAAMRRALRLSILGRHASPNPMVGCVIVDANGVKVGEGYHVAPGELHAEAMALREAGPKARGATAYVTLEPCSHFGRTPPCADALIAAGVARVVAAVEDPDKQVSGRGFARLREAGIEVSVGVCAERATDLNAAFFAHRTTGLPYVIVKTAMTLDGRIAASNGDSKWITSPVTRKWVHRGLRDRVDAIMVGVGTIIADNPSLTTRLDHRAGRNPMRIVLDTNLRTPLDSLVVQQAGDGKTVMVCGDGASSERRAAFERLGVVVKQAKCTNDGSIDMRELAADLGTRLGIQSVLVEGGAKVIASMLEAGLVNRYIATIAPKLIGGEAAPGPVGGAGLAKTMSGALKIEQWNIRRSGIDLVVDGLLRRRMV